MMNPQQSYIGVDVGGTKILSARFCENGMLQQKAIFPTPAHQKEEVIDAIKKAIKTVFSDGIRAIGIGWPGFVKGKEGLVITTPNIKKMKNIYLGKIISESFQQEVFLENDARLFSYAEAYFGKGIQKSPCLGIIMGTGVGTGLVINGEIYDGYDGFAGEAGHMEFETNGEKWTPNKRFSAKGLMKIFKTEESLKKFLSGEKINTIHQMLFFDWLEDCALWLSHLFLLLNPARVVFGGGIGKNVLPKFLPDLSKRLKKQLQKIEMQMSITLECTELEDAGALGAAMYAKKIISNQHKSNTQ
jgi:glucokinase